ncbi:MAG: MobA/MobL family protein [Sphingorhabdus sp.]
MRRSRKAATPLKSGRVPPELCIMVGGAFQLASPQALEVTFKRCSTDVARRLRVAAERIAELEDRRETRNALRRLRREMREWDRIGGRQIRIRMPKPPIAPRTRETKVKITPATSKAVALPKYCGPIIDRRGCRGIFLDLEYDGAQRERWGVARRRIAYQFRLDHAQLLMGTPVFRSNMGEDEHEILACADMLETVNRAARKNAKVGINAVLRCPCELDLAGRVAFLERVSRHFDDLGIAYCMTLHRPDPEGDQRNHHLHIWFTLRSLEHVGTRDWLVGEQLRTDLDGSPAMYTLRRECADIATETCHAFGHHVRYTHRSHAARGLPHRPQEKLGKARAARVRKGEYVAANEANRALIAENEALADEIAARKKRALQPIITAAFGSTAMPAIALPKHNAAAAQATPINIVLPQRVAATPIAAQPPANTFNLVRRVMIPFASPIPVYSTADDVAESRAARLPTLPVHAFGDTGIRAVTPKSSDAYVLAASRINAVVAPVFIPPIRAGRGSQLNGATQVALLKGVQRWLKTNVLQSPQPAISGSQYLTPITFGRASADAGRRTFVSTQIDVQAASDAQLLALGTIAFPERSGANALISWNRHNRLVHQRMAVPVRVVWPERVSSNLHGTELEASKLIAEIKNLVAPKDTQTLAKAQSEAQDKRERSEHLLRKMVRFGIGSASTEQQASVPVTTQEWAPPSSIHPADRTIVAPSSLPLITGDGPREQVSVAQAIAETGYLITESRSAARPDNRMRHSPVARTNASSTKGSFEPASVPPKASDATETASADASNSESRSKALDEALDPIAATVPAVMRPRVLPQDLSGNPLGLALYRHLSSSNPPTREELSEAMSKYLALLKLDPWTMNAHITTLFDRMPTVSAVHEWRELREQPTGADRDAKLAGFTSKILANPGEMDQIRSHAPLFEIMLLHDHLRLAAEQEQAPSRAAGKITHDSRRTENTAADTTLALSPTSPVEKLPDAQLQPSNLHSGANIGPGSQRGSVVPSTSASARKRPDRAPMPGQAQTLGRIEFGATQAAMKAGDGNDLALAHKLVNEGKAVAVYHGGRLKVVRMHTSTAAYLTVAAGDVAAARAIAEASGPVVQMVESMLKTGRLFFDKAGKIAGDPSVNAAFIAFSQQIFEEDAFRSRLIAALDARRKAAAEEREREERYRSHSARSTGSTVEQAQSSASSLRPDKLGLKDGRPNKSTDRRNQIERNRSIDRGLSRSGD